MIQVNNLTFSYPGSSHLVFDGLNLELKSNSIYGLLGKNGMGKSTLLYLIAGLLKPRKGSVLIDGLAASNRQPSVLQEIYMVPEEYELPKLSLKEFVKLHTDFYPHFDTERLFRCLNDFEIPNNLNLNQLSMGQKKKVYMSFALATGCNLLLMDEPTNGLDIPSKALFRKVVAGNLSDQSSLIISTHQVHDIEQLLDHVVILDHSEILLNASIDDITAHYSFSLRQANEMDDSVLYAEPSLQGNMVIAQRKPNEKETSVNLELLFNAVTQQKVSLNHI